METPGDRLGRIKGINNLAGSMLASGKTPEDVLGAIPILNRICESIDNEVYGKTV